MSVNNIKDTIHRFQDVNEEPGIMLTPIAGFNKKPLVSLEEATAPLNNIVSDINTYVYVAKQRAVNPANDLSVDESASIVLYTMEWEPYTDSLYYILNETLRTEDREKLKPWFLYLKLILTALSRLPSISLTVYRGLRSEIDSEYAKYQTGKEVVWWSFSSCSKIRDISERNQSIGQADRRRTLFIIDSITGKDINKHSYFKREQEVLLLPATTVKVVNNANQGHGLHIIHLEEIESSFPLLESVSSEEEIIALRNRPNVNEAGPPPTAADIVQRETYFNRKLSEYIARCRPRSEIILTGKRLNENDIPIIVDNLITNKKCRELFLRESGVISQGALVIAKGLRGNNTLERLFISDNVIGDEGAKAIAQSLSGNNNVTLKQLDLGYNRITDEDIEYLADMLTSNKTLTHLWLSKNQISDRGLKRLAEVLTNANKTLQVLGLEWNRFCDDSNVDILINMLSKNKSLTKLCLNSCKLSKSAIKQLKPMAKTKRNFKLTIC